MNFLLTAMISIILHRCFNHISGAQRYCYEGYSVAVAMRKLMSVRRGVIRRPAGFLRKTRSPDATPATDLHGLAVTAVSSRYIPREKTGTDEPTSGSAPLTAGARWSKANAR